jgi:uncharacterized repeat protein (TIGR04076 family)
VKKKRQVKLDDSFDLYDLRVEVHSDGVRPMVCNHPLGSYFLVSGENLKLPKESTFPIYCLAAVIPLLPAKQRPTHPHDWLTTDMDIACPDPNCGGLFRIKRLRKRRFYHHQVTVTSLSKKKSYEKY